MSHVVAGTTYYPCPECGSCPCPEHEHDSHGHYPGCSHDPPAWWDHEDCEVFGPGRFMICSRCPEAPCLGTPPALRPCPDPDCANFPVARCPSCGRWRHDHTTPKCYLC